MDIEGMFRKMVPKDMQCLEEGRLEDFVVDVVIITFRGTSMEIRCHHLMLLVRYLLQFGGVQRTQE